MAELSLQERLQPSLLDRLTDHAPDKKVESMRQRVLTANQIRDGVKRDLVWLMNCCGISAGTDLEEYPEVEKSVLNFGLPDLTGTTVSNLDVDGLERALRNVLQEFEPRILKNTVRVRIVPDEEKMNHNALVLEIEGQLWAQPTPLQILLKTELDLDTGEVKMQDSMAMGKT